MTIASEITRLQNDKACICAAIENKGVTVGNVTLDDYASCIDAISTGSSVYCVNLLAVGGGAGGYNLTTLEGGGGGGGGEVICTKAILDSTSMCVCIGNGGNINCIGFDTSITSGSQNRVAHGGAVSLGYCVITCLCAIGGGNSGSGKRGGVACSSRCSTGGGGGGACTGGGCSTRNYGGDGGKGCFGYGGGGGGAGDSAGTGGVGYDGGGNGGTRCAAGTSATNYGGGGGGGRYGCGGGTGCQGVVDICYACDGSFGFSSATGGDCCYLCNDCCVHRFTSNGTFTIVG